MVDSSNEVAGDATDRMGRTGGNAVVDRIFESLSHPRRRCVLYHLKDHGSSDVADLAALVAGWERGIPPADVPPETCGQVQADLRHVHLPKLADERLVEYDPRSHSVSYDPPRGLDEFVNLATAFEAPP